MSSDTAAGLAAAAAYFLATLPNAGAEALLSHLTVGAHARLAEDGRKAVAHMGNQQRASADVLIMFGQAIEREQRRMRSFGRYMPAPVDPMLATASPTWRKASPASGRASASRAHPSCPPPRGSVAEAVRIAASSSKGRIGPLPTPDPPTALSEVPECRGRDLRARQLHRRHAIDQRYSRCGVGGIRANRPARGGRLL